MLNKNFIFMLIVLLPLLGCLNKSTLINLDYVLARSYCIDNDFERSYLYLKEDNTYDLSTISGLISSKSEGRWVKGSGRSIFLTSYKQIDFWNQKNYSILESSMGNNSDSIVFCFIDSNFNEVSVNYSINLESSSDFLNGSSPNGRLVISKKIIPQKISINSIGYKSIQLDISEKFDSIKILMKEETDNYLFFKNEKLFLKENSISFQRNRKVNWLECGQSTHHVKPQRRGSNNGI